MNALIALLSYRAFRPDPLDVDEPIGSRFRHRSFLGLTIGTNRLLVISAGRTHWRCCIATFDRAGAPTFGETVTAPPVSNRDGLVEWLGEFARKNKVEHAAIGVGHGFIVSALTGVHRSSDVDTMRTLRLEPGRILGDSVTPDETNGLTHHPEVDNSTLRFKIKTPELSIYREVCQLAGLGLARLVCEQSQMLELAYAAGVSQNPKFRGVFLGLPSSFLFIPLDHTGWHSVVYDPQLDEQAVSALQQSVTQQLPPGGVLAYLDGGMSGMQDLIEGLPAFKPESLLKGNLNASALSIVLN